jgi:Starch binding domain
MKIISSEDFLMTSLSFEIEYRTSFGQAVYLSGNRPESGSWRVLTAVKMVCSAEKLWKTTLKFKLNPKKDAEELHYKFFISDFDIRPESNVSWEPGLNRVVRLKDQAQRDNEKLSRVQSVWGHRNVSITLNYPINFLEYEVLLEARKLQKDTPRGRLNRAPNAQSLERMHPVFTDDISLEFKGNWEHSFLVECSENIDFEYTYALVEKKTQSLRWERNTWRQFSLTQVTVIEPDKAELAHLYPNEKPLFHPKPSHGFESKYKLLPEGTYLKHDLSGFHSELTFHQILPLYYIGPLIMGNDEVQRLKAQNVKAILNLSTQESLKKIQFHEGALLSDCERNNIAFFNFPIDENGFQESIKPLTKFIKYITRQYGRVYVQSSVHLSMAIAVSINFLLLEENKVLNNILGLFQNVADSQEIGEIIKEACLPRNNNE